jgi:hypothetical protein
VFSRAQRPRSSSRQGARLPRVSRLQLLDRSGWLETLEYFTVGKFNDLSSREQKRVTLAAELDWAPRRCQLTCAHVTYVAHWPLQYTMKMPYVRCYVAANYRAERMCMCHPIQEGSQGSSTTSDTCQSSAATLRPLCMTFCRVHDISCVAPHVYAFQVQPDIMMWLQHSAALTHSKHF